MNSAKNDSHLPLISCLCVSNDRPHFLRNAINYFRNQTYPNKELVIVSCRLQKEYKEIIESANSPGIKYFFLKNDQKLTLGELRNYSIELSTGEYFCIWDDDDWYHRNRLEIQLQEAIRNNKAASVIPYLILFHAPKQQAYLSHPYPMPGSILCKKEIATATVKYPSMDKTEDHYFLMELIGQNVLYPVVDPSLYIYVFHGGNTWNEGHFNVICNRGYKFPPSVNLLIEDILNNRYSYAQASELLRSPDVLKEFNYFPEGFNH
jgi:glycosyltransferase involved in cell wall biosynthesis